MCENWQTNEGLGKMSFPKPPVGGVMLAVWWSWKQAGGECPSPSVGSLFGELADVRGRLVNL